MGGCMVRIDPFHSLQGKMDAAASMIEKAIIANPTYAEAYNNLGIFCMLVLLVHQHIVIFHVSYQLV